jgi:hypothetical protein
MPTLDDAPVVRTLTSPVAGDLVQVYDISEQPTGAKTLPLGTLLSVGLLPTDVTTVSGTSATISTRLTVCTSTSSVALTLPAASGTLRDITILKASITSTATATRAGSDVIVTGTSVSATSVAVAPGLTVRLLSDGTTWYHVTNDA